MSAGNATANARAVFLVDPTGVPYSGARPVYTVDANGAYVAGGGSGLPGTTAASLTQADIEAAITTAGVNGIVNLPAGTATLTAALVPLAGQTIRGGGMRATTLLAPLGTVRVLDITANDVTLMDFAIDGQRTLQTGTGDQDTKVGIRVYGGQRATIQRLYIHDTLGNGITVNGAGGATNDTVIRDCSIANIAIDGTTKATAPGQTASTGIMFINGTNRGKVINNRMSGWSQAVGLWYGASDCVVAYNTLIDNYGYSATPYDNTKTRSACEDYGATGFNRNNLWLGNVVDGSTSECFEIAQGCIGTKVIGNTIKNANKYGDNTGYGLRVTGQSGQETTDILVQGNDIVGTTGRRTGVLLNAARVTFLGNSVRDCITTGPAAIYVISDTEVQIVGNSITNCLGGIRIGGSAGDGALIADNTIASLIADNTYCGVYLEIGAQHRVINNTFRWGSGGAAAIIVAGGTYHQIIGNGAYQGAAEIRILTTGNRVQHNTLVNTSAAIATRDVIQLGAASVRNIVTDNTYGSAYVTVYGLYLAAGATYNVVQGNTRVYGGQSDQSGNATNVTSPNHTATVNQLLTVKALGAQTVGTTQATIAHNLGYSPTVVEITMTSAGTIWRSAASDSTNIYLTSDLAGRTADVYVR